MKQAPALTASILAIGLAVVACSPQPATAPRTDVTQDRGIAAASPSPAATPKTIGLDGLGNLKIGQPVPGGSRWAERGAQTSDTCRIVSSPDYPGVYAIVARGKVRRITVGQGSDVELVEGIGVGASEQAVRGAFAGFREEPHKYVAAPGKYLTAPNATSGDPAVRFEIGQDGKVSLIHVGTMPELGYVEGCA